MAGYDRESEVRAFDDTKAGIKGLVDAGVTVIPRFFHHPPDTPDISEPTPANPVPIIDLGIVDGGIVQGREVVVELVRRASEKHGFFQVVNHGIPLLLLDEMLEGVRRFHEQDSAVKMKYYTRDPTRKVRFCANFDLFSSPAANWRDSLACEMAPEPAAKPEDLPDVIREIIVEYTREVQKLGGVIFELLSEALGLKTEYLNHELECGRGLNHLSHYYPPCPEPELTLGTTRHTDPDFITVLLQDQIGGLQVLHQNQWIDVSPVPGALVINIGDLLQLISNDKLKSGEHRVRASMIGPRVSVACFFSTSYHPSLRRYAPLPELLAEKELPKYKEINVREYSFYSFAKGLDGKPTLDHYRV